MRLTKVGLALLIGVMSVGFSGGVELKDLLSQAKGGDPVSGREIYVNTCIRCHGIDGKGSGRSEVHCRPLDC